MCQAGTRAKYCCYERVEPEKRKKRTAKEKVLNAIMTLSVDAFFEEVRKGTLRQRSPCERTPLFKLIVGELRHVKSPGGSVHDHDPDNLVCWSENRNLWWSNFKCQWSGDYYLRVVAAAKGGAPAVSWQEDVGARDWKTMMLMQDKAG